ncbi:hypothetical protein [Fusobacterium nucleatum]|uniref:hypothetical protein n=1 Tax=Fusobacterium nucleatum TaxID=851 RepID=UPI000A5C3BF4|nr:hypothetical protein [Fusobacterium nucleatum]
MTHDFNILGEEEKIYIDDNLILYIMETLEWIDFKNKRKKKGIELLWKCIF